MVVYVFDISRISKCIEEYVLGLNKEYLYEDLRWYVVMSLISEYQLPLNIKDGVNGDHSLSLHKNRLFNTYFHEFACTYSNMYTGLLNMLVNENGDFDLLDIDIKNNLILLNVNGGEYE